MPFNLGSPTSISQPCNLDDLASWRAGEVEAIENSVIRSVVGTVCEHLSDFVKLPSRAILLWRGCDRVAPQGKRQKYHRYPDELRVLGKEKSIALDTRPNGPAIASFLLADGERPSRTGSSNAWSIHHLYSGKYPYLGNDATTHASKDGLHFTQSAGLVAAHPISDAISDEFPFFSWLLRAEAFLRFGYDPDGVFAGDCDELGFAPGSRCKVIYDELPADG